MKPSLRPTPAELVAYRQALPAMLAAPVPMLLFCGAELRCEANDPARPLLPSGVDGLKLRDAMAPWAAWPGFAADVLAVADGAPLLVAERTLAGSRPAVLTLSALGEGGGVLVQISPAAPVADAGRIASEERLRLGLEAGRMVTWEADIGSGDINCSPNVDALYGPSSTAADFVTRMPAEDVAADRARLQAALEDPAGLYQSEFRYIHPDGRLLHLQNWGKVVRNERGEPVRIHGVCLDVTERKQAEIALKLLNETLEQEVEKRTEALMRAELALQQAQRVEALGHLTGGIAHDFNNLLGTMLGNFDLIARRPGDASRVRELAMAGRRAVERGARLTSQLLAFSRTQAMELRPVALGEVLEGMRDMLDRTLGPLVEIDLRVGCGNLPVLSDPTQLEMAVLNLAINARDAMPGGGRLVLASARRTLTDDPVLPPGEYVELTAADDGTGMPADVAERAFDPFFTTKRVGKGTGLGLSQVFGIARQAGGIARLRSAPGHGTVVTMTLPVTTNAPPPPAAEPDRPAPAPADRQATILVVDDDPDLRQVLALSLEDLGYAVLQADSGTSALDRLASAAPDAVIADFAMPGMTGAELALAARREQPDLPLIIASGYADAVPLESVRGPRVRLLRKPFRIDELRDTLALVLAQPARRAGSPVTGRPPAG